MNLTQSRFFLLSKCKVFVCLLLAFSIALPVFAKTEEKPYVYSNWSAGLHVGYQQALETEWLEFSLANAPWQDSGLMGSLTYGYGAEATLDDDITGQVHNMSELKFGVGYQWFLEDWQIVPQIKVVTPISKLPELDEAAQLRYPDNGNLYSEVELATYYSINDRWRVMLAVSHLSSDYEGINGTNITLGVNYRLGKVQIKQPEIRRIDSEPSGTEAPHYQTLSQPTQMQQLVQNRIEQSKREKEKMTTRPTQPHAILSAAPVVLDTKAEFKESDMAKSTHRNLLGQFAVQVASFNESRSIRPFVKLHKFEIEHLSLVKRGQYQRLLYGNYETKKMANIIAEQFKLMGIDCIVVAVDFSQVSDYLLGN